jgi:hypothetical protein
MEHNIKPGNTYIIYSCLTSKSGKISWEMKYHTESDIPWVGIEDLKVDISEIEWYIF